MTLFVDAVEFEGDDLPPDVGGVRVPTRHHAFDVATGLLAHGPGTVRVGFRDPVPSWTSVPVSARLCTACRASVTETITALIDRQLRVVSIALDDSRAVWLYPPGRNEIARTIHEGDT